MATTIPYDFTVHLTDETPQRAIVEQFIERYKAFLADFDKAAAGFDEGFYQGASEAFEEVLVNLLGVDQEAVDAHYRGDTL